MLKSEYYTLLKLLIVFVLIHGCTPMDKITYLNNNQIGNLETSPKIHKHHLEIGDILFVKVISRNEESNNLFNLETNTNSTNQNLTTATLYFTGFTINQQGIIDIPNVGKVYVLNQTLEEAQRTILAKAEEYVINPFVLVKLANFEVTILGEVNLPGRYPVYKEGITIYDALAMAGDINDFGNLKEVKIIRTNKNKKKIYYLDLTDANILNSEFYYLRNNDMIYIQPLKYKGFRKSQSQILLSTISTFAIVFNLYLKLAE